MGCQSSKQPSLQIRVRKIQRSIKELNLIADSNLDSFTGDVAVRIRKELRLIIASAKGSPSLSSFPSSFELKKEILSSFDAIRIAYPELNSELNYLLSVATNIISSSSSSSSSSFSLLGSKEKEGKKETEKELMSSSSSLLKNNKNKESNFVSHRYRGDSQDELTNIRSSESDSLKEEEVEEEEQAFHEGEHNEVLEVALDNKKRRKSSSSSSTQHRSLSSSSYISRPPLSSRQDDLDLPQHGDKVSLPSSSFAFQQQPSQLRVFPSQERFFSSSSTTLMKLIPRVASIGDSSHSGGYGFFDLSDHHYPVA